MNINIVIDKIKKNGRSLTSPTIFHILVIREILLGKHISHILEHVLNTLKYTKSNFVSNNLRFISIEYYQSIQFIFPIS